MQDGTSRSWPRIGRWCGAALAAALGTAALSGDAHAALTAPGSVRAGHNISVFHEIDFVATFGHQVGTPLTVEVFRGEHRIGRVAAHAINTPEGGGLEVNHGPEGAPLEGDCWTGVTPDIRPYDRIRVTDAAGGTDEILVDDIVVESGPAPDAAPDEANIVLTGHARDAFGQPIPDPLEAEFRNTSKLRGGPTRIERPTPDTFKVVYAPPYTMDRGGSASPALLTAATAEHTIGFGHLAPFATGETQIADAGGAPGPALGCEGLAPAAGRNAVTATDDALVTPRSGDLRVGGTAQDGVTSVSVTLDDGPGGGAPVVADTSAIELAPHAPNGADRGWSVAFTAAQLAGFAAEADLTLTPTFTGAGATTAAPLHVRRDVRAPAAPTAAPAAGSHAGTQVVELLAEPGATIHYTTDGSAPTTASPVFGGPLVLERTTTVRAIAVDAAGNVSNAATLPFTILAPPAPVGGGPAAAPGIARLVPVVPSVPTAPQAAPAATPVTLRIARLSAPARMTARRARRAGVAASFVTPAGAEYAEARLVRLAGTRRVVVARRLMAATPGRRQVARFTTASVRRRLRAGRYVLEVRTGPSPARLGPASTARLRITR